MDSIPQSGDLAGPPTYAQWFHDAVEDQFRACIASMELPPGKELRPDRAWELRQSIASDLVDEHDEAHRAKVAALWDRHRLLLDALVEPVDDVIDLDVGNAGTVRVQIREVEQDLMKLDPPDEHPPAPPTPEEKRTMDEAWARRLRAVPDESPAPPRADPPPPRPTPPTDPERYRVGTLWPLLTAELDRRATGTAVVPTGLDGLDELLGGGLPLGQVTLLCGRPGSMKTSVALSWAVRHALSAGPAVVWTLELPTVALLARAVCQHSDAPWSKVLQGGCPGDVAATGRELAGAPLYVVDDRGERGLDVVRAILEKAGGPALLVLDYSQLLAASGPDQRLAVEKASGQLADLAVESGAALLAVSSTSRAAYAIGQAARPGPEDVLSMARDTGRLEFDAAAVLGILPLKREDGPAEQARLVLGKNRYGQTGSVGLALDGQAGTVAEIDEADLPVPTGKDNKVSDGELELAVIEAVTNAVGLGVPLTSLRALTDRVPGARATRKRDAVSRLLSSGRLTGGGGQPYRAGTGVSNA